MHELARLGPDARTALWLWAEGFHGREIAVALGRSHGSTRTLLCRARRRVTSHLLLGTNAQVAT